MHELIRCIHAASTLFHPAPSHAENWPHAENVLFPSPVQYSRCPLATAVRRDRPHALRFGRDAINGNIHDGSRRGYQEHPRRFDRHKTSRRPRRRSGKQGKSKVWHWTHARRLIKSTDRKRTGGRNKSANRSELPGVAFWGLAWARPQPPTHSQLSTNFRNGHLESVLDCHPRQTHLLLKERVDRFLEFS